MARRAGTQNKLDAKEMAALPIMLKCSLFITALGLMLSSLNIYLQLGSLNLLRQADTKHHNIIKRIANTKQVKGGQLSAIKRNLDDTEITELSQKQCRHRQKTEWAYIDYGSMRDENPVTVSFSASQVRTSVFYNQLQFS